MIAAGTDYAIFLIGRYHEARQAGEDRETAYYTAYRGVAHVILASGLTIAGATFCLSFTRLPMFQTMGAPCAVGVLVAVAVTLTLVPAVLTVASRFGLLEPKRAMSVRGWRRVVRQSCAGPCPSLWRRARSLWLACWHCRVQGRATKTARICPRTPPRISGGRPPSAISPRRGCCPKSSLIESDHDMRNSADFLVLNKLAKGIFRR